MAARSAEFEKQKNNIDNRYQQLIFQCEKSIKERKLWLQKTIELINDSNRNMDNLKANLTNQIT